MKKISLLAMGMGLVCLSAQAGASDELAKGLFAGTLSVPMDRQNQIAQQLAKKGFVAQKGQVATEKCGIVPVKNEVKDLNGDGKVEVLMLIGNECTSGVIGSTLYLFTQEADASVQRHLGFSASSYDLLPIKAGSNDPWPAILVRGTGDCLPVWRYKGGRYGFNNLYEGKKGACYVPQSDAVGG